MAIGALIGGAVGLFGANKAAQSQRAAADRAAQAQIEAAKIQAEASKFRPVGVTTGFGSTQYTMGEDGYLTEAGYTLDPRIAAQQEQFLNYSDIALGRAGEALQPSLYGALGGQIADLGQASLPALQGALSGSQYDPYRQQISGLTGTALGTAQALQMGEGRYDPLSQQYGGLRSAELSRATGLLGAGPSQEELALSGLGREALAGLSLDPTEAAQARTSRIQELQAPGRAEAQERLFSDLAAKGLTGLAVESGTGARVNPYLQAQAEAQAQQDALTAAQSYDVARQDIGQDINRATGLLSAARTQGLYGQEDINQALQRAQALGGLERATQLYGREDLESAIARGTGLFGQLRQADVYGQQDVDTMLGRTSGLLSLGQSLSDYETGRFATALAPYQSAIGQAQYLEGLGAGALDLGSALGARERTAAQTGAQATALGMTNAANTQARAAQAAAQQTAAKYGGIGSMIGQYGPSLFNQQQPVYQFGTTTPGSSYQRSFAAPNYNPNIRGTVTQGSFTPGTPFIR